MRTVAFLLVLVSFLALGCGSGGDANTSDTTSANKDVVTSSDTALSDTTVIADTTPSPDSTIIVTPDVVTQPDATVALNDLACYELDGCIAAKCGTSVTQQCAQQCIDLASATGLQRFNAVIACGQTNCSGETPSTLGACLAKNCVPELQDCDKPKVFGTASCPGLLKCIGDAKCGSTDAACYYGCFEKATESAYTKYNATTECVASKCAGKTGTELQNCVMQSCATELTACQTPETFGTANCTGLVQCIAQAGCTSADAACFYGCFEKATESAYTKYNATTECVASKCAGKTGTELQNCVTQSCGTELTACNNDGK